MATAANNPDASKGATCLGFDAGKARGGGVSCATPGLVVIDDPASWHGQLMLDIARRWLRATEIATLVPTLRLPQDLLSIEGAAAVAVPFGVLGGHDADQFTRAVRQALAVLRGRGARVFVAAGNDRPNALAAAGIACDVSTSRRARLRAPSGVYGTSAAAVQLAAVYLVLRGSAAVRLSHRSRSPRS